jgi:hypothetical protein
VGRNLATDPQTPPLREREQLHNHLEAFTDDAPREVPPGMSEIVHTGDTHRKVVPVRL